MNNQERHEARYQRRKAKREDKRLKKLETYNLAAVINTGALYQASKESRRGVYWKASVQRYNMNLLRNVNRASRKLRQGKDLRKGFICFSQIERGKTRYIQSVHFSERIIQRSICSNALIPLLQDSLIHDNAASLKGKGIHFTIKRLKTHLSRHFRKHGLEGYVLLIDFKGYFENVLHEPIKQIYNEEFGEEIGLVDLGMSFVYAFGEKGLGLGSETSQINAIAYPNDIDHYIKEVLRCKYYGRYMDDSYIICETKEEAMKILLMLQVKYRAKGITPSPKKTVIVKLSRGFTFLKIKFSISNTGRIVGRPDREGTVRLRRRLKKFKKFLDNGEMTIQEIYNSYVSWRGFMVQKNARRTVYNTDKYYERLFGVPPIMIKPSVEVKL